MTVVETRCGKVEGIERDGVLHFRAIPFAAPPVDERRWRPPAPPESWTGVRPAGSFGPIAPQGPSAVSTLFGTAVEPPEMSEADCLHLNVTTSGVDDGRRPVLVWIHGGAFVGGSNRNAWYDGTSFARHGAVVVTVNYRLGALGFLHLDGSSNRGLLDQVAALEWVRDNIGAFGGDPAKVTVFGESAGAMSVGALLGMPAASGLFRGAILQSGAASTVTGLEGAADVAERMAAELGGLDAVRAAPWERLVEAQGEVALSLGRAGRGLPFGPVVDGTVLPRPPLETIAAGLPVPVRLMAGTTRDEMTLFLAVEPGAGADLSEETAVRRLDRTNPGRGRDLYDAYRSLLGSDARPRDVWVAVETDRTFRGPAIQLAEAHARRVPDTWMYLFTWASPALDGALGSCHALEIPFVWHSLMPGSDAFTGGGSEARALADDMHAVWIAFATSGDPGWERYEEGRRATRVFGPGGGVVDDPMSARRELWQPSLIPDGRS